GAAAARETPEAPAPPGVGDFASAATAGATQPSNSGRSGFYLADEDLLSVPPEAGELKLHVPPIESPELPRFGAEVAQPTPSSPPPAPKKRKGVSILAGALCAAGLLGALFVGPRAYDFVTGAAQDAERPNEEQPSPTQPRSEPDVAEPSPRTRVSSTTEPAVNPDKPNV